MTTTWTGAEWWFAKEKGRERDLCGCKWQVPWKVAKKLQTSADFDDVDGWWWRNWWEYTRVTKHTWWRWLRWWGGLKMSVSEIIMKSKVWISDQFYLIHLGNGRRGITLWITYLVHSLLLWWCIAEFPLQHFPHIQQMFTTFQITILNPTAIYCGFCCCNSSRPKQNWRSLYPIVSNFRGSWDNFMVIPSM